MDNTSRFLGKVIGIYFIIMSISLLADMNQSLSLINNLIDNPSLLFITGTFTLILGLLMVLTHNIWQWNWRVIITIIAWITLLKGACIILYPQFINETTLMFVRNMPLAYTWSIVILFLGVLLSYFGFKR